MQAVARAFQLLLVRDGEDAVGDGDAIRFLASDRKQVTLLAKNLRTKFAVGYAGVNLHPRPDIAHRPDQVAFAVSRDAVTAAQRGVGAEHA